MDEQKIQNTVDLLRSADHVTVFTGAGISIESGLPSFRGKNGIWERVDPQILELGYFFDSPLASWRLIKKFFYDSFGQAAPNSAHKFSATFESMGFIDFIINQNIDTLHQRAGSKKVIEFHGNFRKIVCLECKKYVDIAESMLDNLPTRCPHCSSVLKPDFVFFGESIPNIVYPLKRQIWMTCFC
jgi:NAD-dependent deacetylase